MLLENLIKEKGIKAIAIDYDETLSYPHGQLPPEISPRIRDLTDRLGLDIFIVSGRFLDYLIEQTRILNPRLIVAENGNIILNSNGNVTVLSDGSAITRLFNPQVYGVKDSIVEFPEEMLDGALEILESNEVRYRIERNNERVMVMPEGTSKKRGLKEALRMENLEFNQLLSFGDGENDISFMNESMVSVGVGNAKPEVKAITDYITKKSYGEGVIDFLGGDVL